jgi:rubrerythrin
MAAITFNADEAFALAEQFEKNGAKFYRKAAENNPGAKTLLLKLAEMEEEHFRIFSKMHKEVSEGEKDSIADPENEAAGYLSAMAGGCVFDVKKDPSETLTGNESFKDVLRIAIGLEKDSIVFYLGLKEMVSKKSGRGKIEDIIQQEMSHITILSGHLEKAR